MNKTILSACVALALLTGFEPAFSQQAPSVVFKPTVVIPQPAYKRQAVNHMNAGRFQAAYDLLKANLEANRTDIDTRFMLAQCAGRLGKNDEALALYQGILAENPDLPRVRLEMARTYMALGQRDKAREAFEAVQATNPPPQVGENIQRFLDSIAAQRPWQARVALSYVVDTNVNSTPGSDQGFTGRRDTGWGLTGNYSYTLPVKPDMAWQFELNAFSLDYGSLNDSDQLVLSASAGPTWKIEDWVISVPAILDHTDVGHDYYNHTFGLSPQVRYAINRDLSLNAGVSITRRDYSELHKDRDGYAYGLTLSLRQQLEDGAFLQPGVRITQERTRQDYFDVANIGVSLGWFTKLPWHGMTLFVQPSINRIVKGDVDPFYSGLGCSGCAGTQADWQYQLLTNLNLPLDKQGTNLSMGVTLTRNDSSVALTDYKRAQLTLMLSRRF